MQANVSSSLSNYLLMHSRAYALLQKSAYSPENETKDQMYVIENIRKCAEEVQDCFNLTKPLEWFPTARRIHRNHESRVWEV